MANVLLYGEVDRPVDLAVAQGPLRQLLVLAGVRPTATHATVSGSDGVFRASMPLEWLRSGDLVDGRLVIRGAPTKCWSVKDVARIELTAGPRPDSVRPESFEVG